jgi:hypothetical protein
MCSRGHRRRDLSVARTIIAEAPELLLGIPPPAPSQRRCSTKGATTSRPAGGWHSSGARHPAPVLGINPVGDWLRDQLDPRMERSM